MTVYVLEKGWAYEGSDVVGVFASMAAARAEAQREDGEAALSWDAFPWGQRASSVSGSCAWTVQPYEVKP